MNSDRKNLDAKDQAVRGEAIAQEIKVEATKSKFSPRMRSDYLNNIKLTIERVQDRIATDQKEITGIQDLIGKSMVQFKTRKDLQEFIEDTIKFGDTADKATVEQLKGLIKQYDEWLSKEITKAQERKEDPRRGIILARAQAKATKKGAVFVPESVQLSSRMNLLKEGYDQIRDIIRNVGTEVNGHLLRDKESYEKRRDLGLSLLKLVVGVANAGILVEIVHHAALASTEAVKTAVEVGKAGGDAAEAGKEAVAETKESLTNAIYAALAAELVKDIGHDIIPLVQESQHAIHAKHAEHHGTEHDEKGHKETVLTDEQAEEVAQHAAKRAIHREAIKISAHYKNITPESIAQLADNFHDLATRSLTTRDDLVADVSTGITDDDIEEHLDSAIQSVKERSEEMIILADELNDLITDEFLDRVRNSRQVQVKDCLDKLSPVDAVAQGLGSTKRGDAKRAELKTEVTDAFTRTMVAAFLMQDYNSPENIAKSYQPWDARTKPIEIPGFAPFIKGTYSNVSYFPPTIANDLALLRALDAKPEEGSMLIGGQHLRRYIYGKLPELKSADCGYSEEGRWELMSPGEKHRMRDAWRSEFIISQCLGEPPISTTKSPEELVEAVKKIIIANTFYHPRCEFSTERPAPTPINLFMHIPEFKQLFTNDDERSMEFQELLEGVLTNQFIKQALTDPNIKGVEDKPRMKQAVDTLFKFLEETDFFINKQKLMALKQEAQKYVDYQCDHPILKVSKEIQTHQDNIMRHRIDSAFSELSRPTGSDAFTKLSETGDLVNVEELKKIQATSKNSEVKKAAGGLIKAYKEKDDIERAMEAFFPKGEPAPKKIATVTKGTSGSIYSSIGVADPTKTREAPSVEIEIAAQSHVTITSPSPVTVQKTVEVAEVHEEEHKEEKRTGKSLG